MRGPDYLPRQSQPALSLELLEGEIDLGSTSCGLWYADQTACRHNDLRMGQLAGQVLDSAGAPIPKANIVLFDSDGTVVEHLESDRDGKFASPHPLKGTYPLLVRAPGFTPLHGTVHAEPGSDVTRRAALTVHLGIGGSCSDADNDAGQMRGGTVITIPRPPLFPEPR